MLLAQPLTTIGNCIPSAVDDTLRGARKLRNKVWEDQLSSTNSENWSQGKTNNCINLHHVDLFTSVITSYRAVTDNSLIVTAADMQFWG